MDRSTVARRRPAPGTAAPSPPGSPGAGWGPPGPASSAVTSCSASCRAPGPPPPMYSLSARRASPPGRPPGPPPGNRGHRSSPAPHIGPPSPSASQKDGAHRHGDQALFHAAPPSLPGPADGEHRAAAGPVGRLHRAAPLGHRVADDGQSQARAAGGPGAGLVHPVEPLKQPGQILLRDPGAVVLHRQHHLLPLPEQGDLDRAAGRAYFTALSVRL